MKAAVTMLAVASLLSGGGTIWWIQSNSERSIILEGCEEVLLKRLRSPSTYNRINVSEIKREPATEDDYLYNNDPEEKRRTAELNARNADLKKNHQFMREIFAAAPMEKLTIKLEYDAENGFGSPIRGYSECAVFRQTDSPITRDSFINPRIDGKTEIEWAFDSLEAAGQ